MRALARCGWTVAGMAFVAACSTPAAGPPGPTGGSEPVRPAVVLTLGLASGPESPAASQAEQFASRVADLSRGSMSVDLRLGDADASPGAERQAAADVVSGELDMALTPSTAWESHGAAGVAALGLPSTVGPDEGMDVVAADDEVVQLVGDGLARVGVVGLALVPEGTRYLVTSEGGNLLRRLGYGAAVWAPRSTGMTSFVEELGAFSTEDRSVNVLARESELALLDAGDGTAVLGNVPLYARINLLVANGARYKGLTDEQRSVMRAAATATREGVAGTRPSEAELAAAYCSTGGALFHAPSSDLGLARTAAQAVRKTVREDPLAVRLLARLDEIAVAAQPSGPQPLPLAVCGRQGAQAVDAITRATIVPDSGDLPDGAYRVELTEAHLVGQGLDPAAAASRAGVWTFRLERGWWRLDRVTAGVGSVAEGVFQVRAQQVWWSLDDRADVVHLEWRVDDSGGLRFSSISSVDPPPSPFDLPWERVP